MTMFPYLKYSFYLNASRPKKRKSLKCPKKGEERQIKMRRRHTFLLFHFQKEKAENNLKIKNLNFIFFSSFHLGQVTTGQRRPEQKATAANNKSAECGGE
jgi:hypothetical protein